MGVGLVRGGGDVGRMRLYARTMNKAWTMVCWTRRELSPGNNRLSACLVLPMCCLRLPVRSPVLPCLGLPSVV
jgi:hypothetical protein